MSFWVEGLCLEIWHFKQTFQVWLGVFGSTLSALVIWDAFQGGKTAAKWRFAYMPPEFYDKVYVCLFLINDGEN